MLGAAQDFRNLQEDRSTLGRQVDFVGNEGKNEREQKIFT
jgi:hypothetical protein